MIFNLTLLLCLFTLASARWQQGPKETDVESEPASSTDSAVVPSTAFPMQVPTNTPLGGLSSATLTNTHFQDTGCVITDGIYGFESSSSSQFVQYVYQIEIVAGSTTPIDTILASLEVSMAEAVLPLLFGPNCQSVVDAPATGLGTSPTDMVINDTTCEVALVDTQNTCVVVDGVFTIYTDGSDVNSDEIVSIIATAANQGAFDDAHEDIVKVTVTEVSTDGLEGGSTTPTPAPATSSSQLGLGMYLGVAAGALVVLGAAIFYRRRKNQGNVDADSTIMTPNAPTATEVPTGEATEPVYDLGSINQ